MQFSEDHIVRYIRGELSEQEAKQVEAMMEVDEELRREVSFHRQLMEGLEKQLRNKVKARLEEQEAAANPENNKKRLPSLRPYWQVAAIGILVLSSGIISALLYLQQPSAESIAADQFEPYPNHITQQYRGIKQKQEKPPLLVKAMNYYSAHRYQAAISHLKTVVEKDNGSALTHFYLANAYMADEKPEKSVKHLKTARRKNLPDKFKLPNQWFLALAYLKANQKQKANQVLEKIQQQSDDYYMQEAKELQKAL